MSIQPETIYTFDDYLVAERECRDQRHEYLDGEVFAMTGASWERNVITTNLVGELHARLKGHPCRVLSNDLRIYAVVANAGTYPDAAVICGAPEFYDQQRDTVTNPTLLIEVGEEVIAGVSAHHVPGVCRQRPRQRGDLHARCLVPRDEDEDQKRGHHERQKTQRRALRGAE